MDWNYVIVCNRNKSTYGGLSFWGQKTEDKEKRSFGGYTGDINKCERYTLEEAMNNGYNFPLYGKSCNHDNFQKYDDFVIEIRRLERLGYRPITIYVR